MGWRRLIPGLAAAAALAAGAALWFSFGSPTAEPPRAIEEEGARIARSEAPLPFDNAQRTRPPPGGPTGAELRRRDAGSEQVDERPSQDVPIQPDSDLDEELRWTQEALDAAREIGERFAVAGEASPPLPGRDASPAAVARAASLPPECAQAGDSCLSGADCCEGLACAGGMGGFATPGRCEAPR